MRFACLVLVMGALGCGLFPTGAAQPTNAVDLRPDFQSYHLAPRRQGARPTCSAFTVAGALEFAAAKRQGHGTRLSIEFLNWSANEVCRDKEDGGFFSDLWKGFAAHGICVEEAMPYQPKFEPARPPSAEAVANAKTRLALGLQLHWIKEWNVNTGLTDEHVAGIKRTLAQGWPVCGGFRWPRNAKWEDGVLQMCPSNTVYDGHSVLLVGYRDDDAQPGGGVFIFRNTSGDGRDGFMPYVYARAYMNDAAWVGFEMKPKAHLESSSLRPVFSDPFDTSIEPGLMTGMGSVPVAGVLPDALR
ncbi:MAG: C1 family peptidase [Verrucomicrobia bacterium]|nr:C1 family peptidase [Verrucomicrobiota bacterium]